MTRNIREEPNEKKFAEGTDSGYDLCIFNHSFSNILNKDVSEETGKMGEPTLPVLYMELADMPVNPMYGYYGEMQPQYYRESITPLTTKRENFR